MLKFNGSTSTGLADVPGHLLDGNGDGKPGGLRGELLRGLGLDRRGVPFNRPIREQLHGQPLSSHAVLAKNARPVPAAKTAARKMVHVNHVDGTPRVPQHIPSPKPVQHRRVQPLKTR